MLSMLLEKDPSKRASLEDLKNCKFINNKPSTNGCEFFDELLNGESDDVQTDDEDD